MSTIRLEQITGSDTDLKAALTDARLPTDDIEDDGRTWRMTLRDGLRFHDGEPVRAQPLVVTGMSSRCSQSHSRRKRRIERPLVRAKSNPASFSAARLA